MNTYLKASLPYVINGMNIPKVIGIIQFNNTSNEYLYTIRQNERVHLVLTNTKEYICLTK